MNEVNSLIPSISHFVSFMQEKEKKNEVELKKKQALTLGAKLVDKINNATTKQDLMQTMLEANKTAYALGVPELASHISTLGSIKSQELQDQRQEELNKVRSDFTAGTLENRQVIDDSGKLTLMKDLPEYQKALTLSDDVKDDALRLVADKYQTSFKDVAGYDQKNGFSVRTYAFNKNNKMVQTGGYLQTKSGGYDNLATKDVENIKPGDVPSMELQELLSREALQKRERALNNKPQIANYTLDDGTTGTGTVQVSGNQLIWRDQSGKVLTNVSGRGFDHKSAMKDPNTYNDENKYQILENKLQGNVVSSAAKLLTAIKQHGWQDNFSDQSKKNLDNVFSGQSKDNIETTIDNLITSGDINNLKKTLTGTEKSVLDSYLEDYRQNKDEFLFNRETRELHRAEPKTTWTPEDVKKNWEKYHHGVSKSFYGITVQNGQKKKENTPTNGQVVVNFK